MRRFWFALVLVSFCVPRTHLFRRSSKASRSGALTLSRPAGGVAQNKKPGVCVCVSVCMVRLFVCLFVCLFACLCVSLLACLIDCLLLSWLVSYLVR